jgi:hypothetical protein
MSQGKKGCSVGNEASCQGKISPLWAQKVPHSSQFPWNGIKSFFPSPSIHPTLNPAGVDGRTEALTSIIIQALRVLDRVGGNMETRPLLIWHTFVSPPNKPSLSTPTLANWGLSFAG